MKRRLITSALPYVNNIPHLGNLIQVLSADVFARFCRLRGYETMYVCGTDEYGTATETKALEEGVSPRDLCDKFHAIHAEIYKWFGIEFDKFGRTSTPEQTEIVQGLFKALDSAGLIKAQTIEQLFCGHCNRFLADRYVLGTCPHCGYEGARGDQCENCGKLLDPTDLKNPKCSTCESKPEPKSTDHLYIDLPAIKDRLEEWMKKASVEGFWANNAIAMTQAWIRDGLHERAITRDLKWGIPVPKPGYENKVFYVWFDAPIGYVSITATKTKDWKSWWQNPENVELFQFIGKDNIPFHTVIFPSTLLGSGQKWTMLHHMSSTEYLNYEGGKFSKSKGVGVFGNDAIESGIPAEVWRFYIYYNRPEKSDYSLTWQDLKEKVNGELIGNLGNLVNRTLTFVSRYFEGKLPEAPAKGSEEEKSSQVFWEKVRAMEAEATAMLERADLRDAFRKAFEISDMGNKAFQAGEPWKTRASDPAKAQSLIRDLCYLIKDLAILTMPYIPQASVKIAAFLGQKLGPGGLQWADLGKLEGINAVSFPEILFKQLEDDQIEAWKARYSGSQKERAERDAAGITTQGAPAKAQAAPKVAAPSAEPIVTIDQSLPLEARFSKYVELRVARIEKIERHPKADKLYVETIDVGGESRVIVSGLVPHYKEEELLGKRVILVANLKPAKLRGVESQGMLLAASMPDLSAPPPEEGAKGHGPEIVEVLDASWAEPGTRVVLEGSDPGAAKAELIDVDSFFSIPIRAENGIIMVGDKKLTVAGKAIQTEKVKSGEVG